MHAWPRLRQISQPFICGVALVVTPMTASFGTESLACYAGLYRDSSGASLILSHATDGNLRYMFLDGRTGLLRPSRPGVLTAGPGWNGAEPEIARLVVDTCDAPQISFALEGVETKWTRVALQRRATQFTSLGDTITADLLLPPDAGPSPLVVFVHGSESQSAREHASYPYVLAAAGFGVFVYDKRGTGTSGGTYTQNFYVLAQDAAAAVREARRMAGARASSVGLFGGSQGGWVAPRAATQADVDFVVVAFGLLGSPLEEDAWEIRYELMRHGFGEAEIARAKEVTDATEGVLLSGFSEGYGRVRELRQRYGAEPWFPLVVGEYSGEILRRSEQELRQSGRAELDNLGIHWQYDAVGTVAKVSSRQVWLLACEDSEAPSAPTFARLADLRAAGKDVEIVLFPGTDHGVTEFVESNDGARVRTRFAEGYFSAAIDAVRGRLEPRYGLGRRVTPGRSAQDEFRVACAPGAVLRRQTPAR